MLAFQNKKQKIKNPVVSDEKLKNIEKKIYFRLMLPSPGYSKPENPGKGQNKSFFASTV